MLVLCKTMLLKLPPLLITERAGQTRDSWAPLLSTVEAEQSAFLISSGGTGVAQSRTQLKRLSSSSSRWYDAPVHGPHFTLLLFKECVCAQSLSRVRLCATLWTVARQTPLTMGFSRQEYWSGLLFPTPGDLPDQGSNPRLLQWQAYSSPLSHQGSCARSRQCSSKSNVCTKHLGMPYTCRFWLRCSCPQVPL